MHTYIDESIHLQCTSIFFHSIIFPYCLFFKFCDSLFDFWVDKWITKRIQENNKTINKNLLKMVEILLCFEYNNLKKSNNYEKQKKNDKYKK